jgi:hypothetical protein
MEETKKNNIVKAKAELISYFKSLFGKFGVVDSSSINKFLKDS